MIFLMLMMIGLMLLPPGAEAKAGFDYFNKLRDAIFCGGMN